MNNKAPASPGLLRSSDYDVEGVVVKRGRNVGFGKTGRNLSFRSLNLAPILQLRPPVQNHRFVLDTHLGRLTTYLRLLGFDTLYESNKDDRDLARISHDEGLILLSRDCGLLKRNEVITGISSEQRKQRNRQRRFSGDSICSVSRLLSGGASAATRC